MDCRFSHYGSQQPNNSLATLTNQPVFISERHALEGDSSFSEDLEPLLCHEENVAVIRPETFCGKMADSLTDLGYRIARRYRQFQRDYHLVDASYDIELGPS